MQNNNFCMMKMGCPPTCLCEQQSEQKPKKKKYFTYRQSTPPHMKPVVYEPCVHLHFKSEHVERECLTKEQYYDLLATPKGYPWLGEVDCQNPALEKNKPKKKKKKAKKECEETGIRAGDFADEFVEDMWDVMSPEITCRLIDFLVNEFGMSVEEAEDFIDCKTCVGKQTVCRKKKSKAIIGLGPKYKWVKEFSDVFSKRIEQYIISMLMTRRTPRTKRIAEKILECLCDLTGEKTTLQNPKTKVQRLMVLIADRLALWIDNMMTDIDIPQKIRLSLTEEEEEEEEPVEEELRFLREDEEEPKEEKPKTPQGEKEEKAEEKQEEKEQETPAGEAEEKEPEPQEEKPAEEQAPTEEDKPAETKVEEEPEPVAQPEPEKQLEPEKEPEPEPEQQPQPEQQPEPEPEKEPEPVAEEPEPAPEPEQTVEEPETGEVLMELALEAEEEKVAEAEEAPVEEEEIEEGAAEEEEAIEEEPAEKEVEEPQPKEEPAEEEKEEPEKVSEKIEVTPEKKSYGDISDLFKEKLKVIPAYKKPPPAFAVKRKGGSRLEVHKLSSGTVSKQTAQVRGIEVPPSGRKVPNTASPLNLESIQDWGDWASNIALLIDEWDKWIDGTLTDAEKLMQEKKKQTPGQDWKQWREQRQIEAQKWRVEKERMRVEGKRWDKKIDKTLREQPEVEVRSTDM